MKNLLIVIGGVFIALKLAGLINWSWWLVTLPLWGGTALIFGILILSSLSKLFTHPK